jgi:hypothetical protein
MSQGTTSMRPLPMGVCWCGCGEEVPVRSFFYRGHDRKAEAMLIAMHYDGSVAGMLAAHGYGPGKESLHDAFRDFTEGWTNAS